MLPSLLGLLALFAPSTVPGFVRPQVSGSFGPSCAVPIASGVAESESQPSLSLQPGPALKGEPALDSSLTGPGTPSPPQDPPRCRKCKSAGRLPCPEHAESDCALEDNVLFCSDFHGCEICGGTGWLDCEACERPDVEEAIERKRAGIPVSARRLADLDNRLKRPLHKVESEHFRLVWDIESLKVGRKRLGRHELMHLTVDRLEKVFDEYTTLLGVDERAFPAKPLIMVWRLPKDHTEAAGEFCGATAQRGVKLMGQNAVYSVPGGDKRWFKDDEQLHRDLVHNTVHLLMSHQRPSWWVGYLTNGWADAGLAHWFEERYWGKCDCYCYEEVLTGLDFGSSKWKPGVRKMVAAEKNPPMAEVVQHKTATLTADMHAVAFSYMDYLMAHDSKKVDQLLHLMRKKKDTREAIQTVYGWGLLEFERAWREWVLETYPSR